MAIDVTTLTKPLPRSDLAQFLPNPRAIDAFESMQSDVAENIPASIAQIVDLTNDLLAAPYIAWQASGTLENERLAAAGAGVTITIGASNATFSLTPSGVAAATYGGGSSVPSISVDQYGRIVSASDIALNSDNVTEGSVNLFYTDARSRAAISVAGSLAYNPGTGVISYTTPNSDGITEGAANLYFTNARARGAISAGSGLSYDSGAGVMSLTKTLDDGVYTPTLTNGANVAASTASACQYMRVGDTVTVSGRVDIDPTAAAMTQLSISLPIASNFATAANCGGTGASGTGADNESAAIYADAANDRAVLIFLASNTANHDFYFSFTYRVLP